ncbi:MAG: hypothetical protein JNL21_17710 [Myxococcales bacterium]|nr:hypothetical protein [Myxococcales bacterium]
MMAALAHESRVAGELGRVREHLVGALATLREADTRHLDAEVGLRRSSVIAELQRYIERGQFPRNTRTLEMRPAVIDDFGTRCALAHLAEQSGGAELVSSLSAVANHERVHALRTHEGLARWLRAMGLSVEEAARIQPSYAHVPYPPPLDCACRELGGPVLRGTVTNTSASGACDIRIDEVLSSAELTRRAGRDLPVGETLSTSCTNLVRGSKVLVTWPEQERDPLDPGPADRPSLRIDSGSYRFETCLEPGSAVRYRGKPPPPAILSRRQLDEVVGKSLAECRVFLGVTPTDSPEPTPTGRIAPNPEAPRRPREPAPVESAQAPEPVRTKEDREAPAAQSPDTTPLLPTSLHYIGGGGILLVVSAAAGYAWLTKRGPKR